MPSDRKIGDLIDYCIKTIGYLHMIMLKDSVLVMSGVAIGMLVSTLLTSRLMHRTRHLEDLGKVTSVKYKHDNKTHYITHVDTFLEALEFVILMVYFPFAHKNEYTISDKNRAKWCLRIVIVITVILCILSYVMRVD